MTNPLTIAPPLPASVYQPQDAAALAELLSECNTENRAVTPWGGGTLQHLGNPPSRRTTPLLTTALNQIVDYAYDDLTITVGAGMTLSQISAALAEHGQYLPIDVPHPDQATIGGVLATGVNGPLRLRFGPARDFMLGNRFATVDGNLIKAGSKVVKNVAGYELHKVMVGSFGTLGVLTEATFKIFPQSAAQATLWASFDTLDAACAAVPKLWNLNTPPIALELLDASTAQVVEPNTVGAWHIVIRFGGSKAAMAAARDVSAQVATANAARSTEIVTDAVPTWRAIADVPATLREQLSPSPQSPDALLVRIGVPPKDLHPTLQLLLERALAHNLPPPRLFAHAAIAVIYASFQGEAAALETIVKELRARLHASHAPLLVESAPASLRASLNAWDEVGPTFKMMQALKHKFDPNNILNPGRFFGGL